MKGITEIKAALLLSSINEKVNNNSKNKFEFYFQTLLITDFLLLIINKNFEEIKKILKSEKYQKLMAKGSKERIDIILEIAKKIPRE